MNKPLLALTVCAFVAVSAEAESWSFGIATGPFVFGEFVRRTLQTTTETGTGEQTTRLSAKTRPGLSVDLEYGFAPRWAVRAEGTFTHAPLAVKGSSDSGSVSLDAGTMNVGTATVPLVFRINPNGTFRFHLLGGPAYAVYHVATRRNAGSTLRPFAATRGRWGAALGGGMSWNWTEHFAVEGEINDTATASSFSRSDFPAGPGLVRIKIPRTHNVHTTVGLRYRF